jgi:hypothetical protein
MEYYVSRQIKQENIPEGCPEGEFYGENIGQFHISFTDKRYMINIRNVYINGNK